MLISKFDVPPIFKEFSRVLELHTQQPDFANSRIQLVFPTTGNNSGNTGNNSGNIGYNNIIRNRIVPRATLIDENNNNKILTPNYNLLNANNSNNGNGGVAAAGARRVN